jgi:hypothetical protein
MSFVEKLTPSLEQQLQGAIRALPYADGGEPPEWVLDQCRVMLVMGVTSALAKEDIPNGQDANPNQTSKELAAFKEKAAALWSLLSQMSAPALRQIEPNWLILAKQLSKAIESAERANAAPRFGRSKQSARDLAEVCQSVFVTYTGRPASVFWDSYQGRRHGSYFDFLDRVFEIAGIDAKASSFN